ncbi:MAG: hypothetical protein GY765_28295 [bacterium]|nr:hypothetical protein [bacterium]
MKTKKKVILFMCAMMVFSVSMVFGQQSERRAKRSPLVAALDADQDKVISASELGNAANALKALDADGNGELTMEELKPQRSNGNRTGMRQGSEKGRRSGRKRGNLIFKTLDADGDRKLSTPEMNNAAAALGTLDRNGDGQLTKDELRPQPRILALFDADGNSTVSPAEIDNAPEVLRGLDTNGDGTLTLDDLRQKRSSTQQK